MSSETTLWMGDLEEYMDQNFVINAFHQMGEAVVNAKLIVNKQIKVISQSHQSGNKYFGRLKLAHNTQPKSLWKTPLKLYDKCIENYNFVVFYLDDQRTTGHRTPHAYCFVEFPDVNTAKRVMLRLNGKIMPGSNPPKRFKLNHASFGKGGQMGSEYSLFVGDLTDDVDDLILYSAFSKRYKSCRAAKVVLDNEGKKRGYGFVRFTDEADQGRALNEMNNFSGIGGKAIRVSLAAPKRQQQNAQQYNPYGNYYQGYQYPYQQNYWQGYNQNYYNQYYQNYPQDNSQTQSYDTTASTTTSYNTPVPTDTTTENDSDSEVLEDPCEEIDVAKMNKEYMEQSEEFYTAMEESRWNPLDSVTSTLTVEAS